MTKAQFGVCLPVYAGASAFDYNVDFGVIKSTISDCEELGFNSLWVPDHLTLGRDGYNLECWTVLSAASQLCESMRLGTLVLCAAHRSPALLAKMAATLDVLSNGRMELGLGAGWRASEQISYGLPWEPSAKARVQRLIETVEIVKGMWSNESFTYSGRYYNVKDAVCAPKPLQKPYPRIWLAGKGEKLVLKTVAKYADGWNVDEISPEEFARKLAVLHAHCRSLGTDYDRIVKSLENFVLISDKAEDLERVVSWSNWAADAQAEYGESKPVVGHLEDMETKYILGTVREVTDRVADYVKTGVQHFMMYFLDYPSTKSIRSFAREVIPSL